MAAKQKIAIEQDALGWLLVWDEDGPGGLEGEPLGAPDYYPSEKVAQAARRRLREGKKPHATAVRLDLTAEEMRELWSAYLEGHEDCDMTDEDAAHSLHDKLASAARSAGLGRNR